jgi:UDP-N-acetylglucosamine 2-epimerase (non-hydrolysing)/GDP/UDP-N,N'-diacetylbacillosamine 2-epimerase (hydrolysing)
MRHIIAITGSRADFGIYRPVFKAINNHPALNLSLIVSCMHLVSEFGMTCREIEKDGFRVIARVDMIEDDDSPSAMARSLAKGIIGFTRVLEKRRPDILLVNTDRIETLAGAIAGAFMNIPVAHMHGGEVSGSIDESIRHAVTKFAHIHFPATNEAAQRIIRLGEDPSRVFVTGAAGLDSILNKKLIEPEVLAREYKLDLKKPIFLVVHHPVTTEVEKSAKQMRVIMNVLVKLKQQTILIYPNADAGGRAMIKVIKQYSDYSFIKPYKSLPHIDYLSLMKISNVMIGNSSSAIIEAPSFGLPVVNIGIRQQGRLRAFNVIDVSYNEKEIINAIKKSLSDKYFLMKVKRCKNPYGDGKASLRIVDILNRIDLSSNLLQKKITY